MGDDMGGAPPPPAGWYGNPAGGGQRYWDGARWTEHYGPPVGAPAAPAAQPRGGAAKGCLGVATAVFVGIVVVAIATSGGGGSGSSNSSGQSAPFRVSDASASAAVTSAINGASTSPGLDGQPTARCVVEVGGNPTSTPGRNWCNISYTVKTPAGIDGDLELIQPTAGFWKVLFSDPRFRGAYVLVRGPTTTVGGKSGNSRMFSLSCDRAAARQIDWNNVDGKGLRTLCTYAPLVKGVPGS